MASTQPPKDRDEFRVAIVCALPCEADAVTLLFDEVWDEISAPYERLETDRNTYITGRIGRHNVVLVTLPSRGTTAAARGSAYLTLSYHNLKLALLVGTCGGMPRIDNIDAYLGDVVIGKDVTQHDFGAHCPSGFVLNDAAENMVQRANKELRILLANYEMEFMRNRLKTAAKSHLKGLQVAAMKAGRKANYQYPGKKEDRLFPPDYHHEHKEPCTLCEDNPWDFCEATYRSSCIETGCDFSKLIPRCHQDDLPQGAKFTPEIFLGRYGSVNIPVTSGNYRDELAAKYNLDAFDTEGAGYADSHSNTAWEDFASATAASVARAVLDRYPSGNSVSLNVLQEANELSVANNSLVDTALDNKLETTGSVAYISEPVVIPGEKNPANSYWRPWASSWKSGLLLGSGIFVVIALYRNFFSF
ncbi:transcription factor [Fusarium sp. NRRL 52700]|nr:transcription factor [Fusarium sp. NRRL 52700]